MTRKRIALEHPIDAASIFSSGTSQATRAPSAKVGRKQSFPDAPDRSRAQHRADARHHNVDAHTRALAISFDGFANKSSILSPNGEIFALQSLGCGRRRCDGAHRRDVARGTIRRGPGNFACDQPC